MGIENKKYTETGENDTSVDVHLMMPQQIRDQLKIMAVTEQTTMREIIIQAVKNHIRKNTLE